MSADAMRFVAFLLLAFGSLALSARVNRLEDRVARLEARP